MTEFKVGDKVRVTERVWDDGYDVQAYVPAGTTGTIKSLISEDTYPYFIELDIPWPNGKSTDIVTTKEYLLNENNWAYDFAPDEIEKI